MKTKSTVDRYIPDHRHDKAVVHGSRQVRRARRNRHFKAVTA